LSVGFAYVYQQKDADHYEIIGKTPTSGGAGTFFWSPELDRYYVAAPTNDQQEAPFWYTRLRTKKGQTRKLQR
jgi:hypothetical protein